jgi:hypothetical protein
MNTGTFDPKRRLCPDGACIGVIGDDGRCPVCGRSAGGSGKGPVGVVAGGAGAGEAPDEDDREDGDAEDGDGDAKSAAAAFDPNRRLCPDGTCVGLIGADGVCTVCGQKAD